MTSDGKHRDKGLAAAIRQTQAGDTSAFEAVVRLFERPIRAWLAVQAPPGLDVDDVAQRSFMAAFTRIRDFDPETDFAAWLFAIARFQLKTELTRHRRIADYHSRFARDLLLLELERRPQEAPELPGERVEHLRECVTELREPLRQFIEWRYEEGVSLDEISTRCGRSVAAVKKQLFKLRRALRDCVERRLAAGGSP